MNPVENSQESFWQENPLGPEGIPPNLVWREGPRHIVWVSLDSVIHWFDKRTSQWTVVGPWFGKGSTRLHEKAECDRLDEERWHRMTKKKKKWRPHRHARQAKKQPSIGPDWWARGSRPYRGRKTGSYDG